MQTQRKDAIALTGRILGALFSLSPDSSDAAPLVQTVTSEESILQWPVDHPALPGLAHRLRLGASDEQESLAQAWQRLFIGPWALPAPPWGSVWLDRENVLFGDSMLELSDWMHAHGIEYAHGEREPCDHFGTLLLMAAWLAETSQQQALEELLAWHLFPWSERFLTVFVQNADHPFYQALGELARLTLDDWRSKLSLPVAKKQLWR